MFLRKPLPKLIGKISCMHECHHLTAAALHGTWSFAASPFTSPFLAVSYGSVFLGGFFFFVLCSTTDSMVSPCSDCIAPHATGCCSAKATRQIATTLIFGDVEPSREGCLRKRCACARACRSDVCEHPCLCRHLDAHLADGTMLCRSGPYVWV